MNCLEARKYFANLLDHSSDERLRKVNDHLAACARCRQELAAVAACRRLVSALPPVEPPAGFTSRVMAEVRDTAHRSNLWQRLFSPLQLKLPLQATAVVLIGVLAVFIYQKEAGHRQSTTTTITPPNGLQKQAEADKLPPSDRRARALKTDAENAQEAGAQKPGVKGLPQTEQPRSPAEPAEQAIGGIQPGAPPAGPADGTGRSLAPSKLEKQSSAAGDVASPRREQLSPFNAHAPPAATAVPQDKHTDHKDTASARDPSSSAAPAEKRPSSSLDALKSGRTGLAFPAGRELTLRLKGPARGDETAAAPLELERPQIEPRPSPVEGEFKDLDQARQRAIATDQPQSIWVTIRSGQYEGFKKELAGLGNVESELPAPAHKNEVKPADQLRIKVTILPPLSSADSPSSR